MIGFVNTRFCSTSIIFTQTAILILTMPKHEVPKTPTDTEVRLLLGERAALFIEMLLFLRENYCPSEDYRFSQKDGWTVFYRRGGKSLCYVHLREGGFTVTVVIGESLSDKVKSSGVGKETWQLFQNAKQFHDGKWLHFDVENKHHIEDIKKLLLIKKNPVRKERMT